ncbi:hypothetical protein CYMTET_55740 [Cymbomonas tetramitiformis]|uniref:Uncharacterized protein n=1 Tax=Cymbomonas tetramitiformis TaxID=36881 RepID=A0AAE0BDR2_9CHLO|nr:hypothetical protein CYMTET_55740 [Cymbomonas tetramitiformis]
MDIRAPRVDDLLALGSDDPNDVLATISERFHNDCIYTTVGPVLIAVNPYRLLPIYGVPSITKYALSESIGIGQASEVEDVSARAGAPHIYQVAARALRAVALASGLSQSVVISGESGAGKTEATKQVVEFLAVAADGGSGGPDQSSGVKIKQQVMSTSTVLEAFGNAKTVRNDNSSRFGKLFEVQFGYREGQGGGKGVCEGGMGVVGARITSYLLEKTRVTFVAPEERLSYRALLCKLYSRDQQLRLPYLASAVLLLDTRLADSPTWGGLSRRQTIVRNAGGWEACGERWQLCAGASEAQRARLQLRSASEYCYLQGGCSAVPLVDDARRFEELSKAMTTVGLAQEQKEGIFEVVAGVLALGNIEFEESGEEGSRVPTGGESEATLITAARLIGIPQGQLERVLTTQDLTIGGSTITKLLAPSKAEDARNALARRLYSALFDWLVASINTTTSEADGPCLRTVNVLDIFGFENFPVNSLEQLSINYANEKLHGIFCRRLFTQEYEAEGIPWEKVQFPDNSAQLRLLERPLGLLALLDEETAFPKATDRTMIKKLATNLLGVEAKQMFSVAHGGEGDSFTLGHFAGSVEYSVEGFLEKNKDNKNEMVNELMAASTNSIVRAIFSTTTSPGKEGQKSSATPVSKLASKGKVKKAAAAAAAANAANASPSPGRGVPQRSKGTVMAGFRTQLTALVNTLEATEMHFVRCVKPNSAKQPSQVDGGMVVEQLQYTGILACMQVLRSGFQVQVKYPDFLKRLWLLTREADPRRQLLADPKAAVKQLLTSMSHLLTEDDWALGHTKAFVRTDKMLLMMVEAQDARLQKVAVVIQTYARRLLARLWVGKLRRWWAKLRAMLCRWICRRQYLKICGAVRMIKEQYRLGNLRRDAKLELARLREQLRLRREAAATLLQQQLRLWILRLKAKRELIRLRRLRACRFIQQHVRLWRLRRRAKEELIRLRRIARAKVIQREVRLWRLRLRAKEELIRLRRHAAAVKIQRVAWRWLQRRIDAAVVMQRQWRVQLQRRHRRRTAAAVQLQRQWRAQLRRRQERRVAAARVLQRRWRHELRRRYGRLIAAVVRVQRFVRRWRLRRKAQQELRRRRREAAVVKIQRHVRQWLRRIKRKRKARQERKLKKERAKKVAELGEEAVQRQEAGLPPLPERSAGSPGDVKVIKYGWLQADVGTRGKWPQYYFVLSSLWIACYRDASLAGFLGCVELKRDVLELCVETSAKWLPSKPEQARAEPLQRAAKEPFCFAVRTELGVLAMAESAESARQEWIHSIDAVIRTMKKGNVAIRKGRSLTRWHRTWEPRSLLLTPGRLDYFTSEGAAWKGGLELDGKNAEFRVEVQKPVKQKAFPIGEITKDVVIVPFRVYSQTGRTSFAVLNKKGAEAWARAIQQAATVSSPLHVSEAQHRCKLKEKQALEEGGTRGAKAKPPLAAQWVEALRVSEERERRTSGKPITGAVDDATVAEIKPEDSMSYARAQLELRKAARKAAAGEARDATGSPVTPRAPPELRKPKLSPLIIPHVDHASPPDHAAPEAPVALTSSSGSSSRKPSGATAAGGGDRGLDAAGDAVAGGQVAAAVGADAHATRAGELPRSSLQRRVSFAEPLESSSVDGEAAGDASPASAISASTASPACRRARGGSKGAAAEASLRSPAEESRDERRGGRRENDGGQASESDGKQVSESDGGQASASDGEQVSGSDGEQASENDSFLLAHRRVPQVSENDSFLLEHRRVRHGGSEGGGGQGPETLAKEQVPEREVVMSPISSHSTCALSPGLSSDGTGGPKAAPSDLQHVSPVCEQRNDEASPSFRDKQASTQKEWDRLLSDVAQEPSDLIEALVESLDEGAERAEVQFRELMRPGREKLAIKVVCSAWVAAAAPRATPAQQRHLQMLLSLDGDDEVSFERVVHRVRSYRAAGIALHSEPQEHVLDTEGILRCIALFLQRAQVPLKRVFREFDRNVDDELSKREMGALLVCMFPNSTLDELHYHVDNIMAACTRQQTGAARSSAKVDCQQLQRAIDDAVSAASRDVQSAVVPKTPVSARAPSLPAPESGARQNFWAALVELMERDGISLVQLYEDVCGSNRGIGLDERAILRLLERVLGTGQQLGIGETRYAQVMIDLDGDGRVSFAHLEAGLKMFRKLGVALHLKPELEVEDVLTKLACHMKVNRVTAQQVFGEYDSSGRGALDEADLGGLITMLLPALTSAELLLVLQQWRHMSFMQMQSTLRAVSTGMQQSRAGAKRSKNSASPAAPVAPATPPAKRLMGGHTVGSGSGADAVSVEAERRVQNGLEPARASPSPVELEREGAGAQVSDADARRCEQHEIGPVATPSRASTADEESSLQTPPAWPPRHGDGATISHDSPTSIPPSTMSLGSLLRYGSQIRREYEMTLTPQSLPPMRSHCPTEEPDELEDEPD